MKFLLIVSLIYESKNADPNRYDEYWIEDKQKYHDSPHSLDLEAHEENIQVVYDI